MPVELASRIEGFAITYHVICFDSDRPEEQEAISRTCMNIGFHLAYDAAVQLRNRAIMPYGLTIWKHVYRYARYFEQPELLRMVMEYYDDLEGTLQRPERPDLLLALELPRIFRDDLNVSTLAFPPYPSYLD